VNIEGCPTNLPTPPMVPGFGQSHSEPRGTVHRDRPPRAQHRAEEGGERIWRNTRSTLIQFHYYGYCSFGWCRSACVILICKYCLRAWGVPSIADGLRPGPGPQLPCLLVVGAHARWRKEKTLRLCTTTRYHVQPRGLHV
jgi:hypothetical protein